MKKSSAGTLESGDIYIEIAPVATSGISIKLDSIVAHQFGKKIKSVISSTLKEMGVDGVQVVATDKGALDCTIKARVQAAVLRGDDKSCFKW
ncbi:MAG: citrate lyase acyl carrier protein [Clostridia bacterium]